MSFTEKLQLPVNGSPALLSWHRTGEGIELANLARGDLESSGHNLQEFIVPQGELVFVGAQHCQLPTEILTHELGREGGRESNYPCKAGFFFRSHF